MTLSVSTALRVLEEFMAEVKASGEAPMAAVVACPAGEILAAVRMDGVHPRIMDIARRKAYSAAWREAPTMTFKGFLEKEGVTLADFGDPRLTSMPGGVPLRLNGRIIGSVAVSGRPPAEDHQLAEVLAARLLAMVAAQA